MKNWRCGKLEMWRKIKCGHLLIFLHRRIATSPPLFFAFLILFLLLAVVPAHAFAPVQEVTTENGVSAWLMADDILPVVSVRVAFLGAGQVSDPPAKEGLAYLGSQILAAGGGDMDAVAFARALDDHAITIETHLTEDNLYVTLKFLRGQREEAFRLLGQMLKAPRMDEATFAREQSSLIAKVERFNSNPSYISEVAWHAAAFPGHPYGRAMLGTRESLQNLTQADVQQYFRKALTRARLVVAAAGAVSASELAPLLEGTFGVLAAEPDQQDSVPDIAEFTPVSPSAHVERDLPQTLVTILAPGLKRGDADFLVAYVLNHVLGGDGLTSRLGVEIREKRGLAYHAGTELEPFRHAALLRGSFSTRADMAQAAVQAASALMDEMAAGGVSPAELEDAKTYIIGAFPLQLDKAEKRSSYLMTMKTHGLGKDYLEKRNGLIQAVTLGQVNAMARRLLDPTRRMVVTVGKAQE